MDLLPILHRFEPVTLKEMDGVKLQDRVDTKYVIAAAKLPALLEAMIPHYRLLQVEGRPGTDYRTLYLDTPDLKHYRDHHNRRTFRCKVRYREYAGSGLAYLEVKRKTGRGRTDKARMRVEGIPERPTPEQLRFIRKASGDEAPLQPTLRNEFTRYTFVAKDRPERLTLDVELRYSAPAGSGALEGIAVAEVKQARADRSSPFVRLMRAMGTRPSGMSKYCIGLLAVGSPVKHNAFKEVLLRLDRLRAAA